MSKFTNKNEVEEKEQDRRCVHCGKEQRLNRITVKSLFNDFVGAVFSFEKGFVYTLIELIKHPSALVVGYLEGARTRTMNPMRFLTVSVVIFMVFKWLVQVSGFELSEDISVLEQQAREGNPLLDMYFKIMNEYMNLLLFAAVPALAAITYLLERKGRFNYAEHLVVAAFFTGIYNIASIFQYVPFFELKLSASSLLYLLISFLPGIYLIYAYITFVQGSTGVKIVKSLAIQVLMLIFQTILALALAIFIRFFLL